MAELYTVCGARILIDENDLKSVHNLKWRVVVSPNGRVKIVASFRVRGRGTSISLGAYLLKPARKLMVICKNGNGFDYRRRNLKVVEKATLRHAGIKSGSHGTSKYHGVSKVGDRWRARIQHQGKCVHIGYFKDEGEAALAYNQFAKRLYGSDANLNKV